MNWFKNLNATPRLMISFGVLLALTMGMGYLAITSLSQANDRLATLYQEDMLGSMRVNDIAVARAMNGRAVRDALLHINETAVVADDENVSFTEIASMHSDIEAAEKSAHSKESQDVLAVMREALPDYEKGHHAIYDRIKAKDLAGAEALLGPVTTAAKPLFDAAEHAIQIKQEHAQEKFQTNAAAYQTARNLVIGATILSLVFGVILSFVIARGISVPLSKAVNALQKVAVGDLTARLDVDTKDEVGNMASAFNTAVERLNNTLQEVADSAANASSSSQQLAAASEAIASGAQEQAASLEETSASLEQISAAVRLSAENARQASELASGTHNATERGQEGTSAVAAMADISAASAKISEIISTVDEIAFQTNLLAVNAAVEAARAGDEGRGFAVVASEVRILAQRSAGSAKEIKGLIQDSLRKVERGSELVNRVTKLVGEIALSSGEQSSGIEQVNTAMTQMDQVTQSNSAETEELSSTAQVLSSQSARLLELVNTFSLGNSSQSAPGERGQQPSPQNLRRSPVAAQRPARPATRTVAGKLASSAPSGRKPLNHSPTLVASPAGRSPAAGRSDDASFEEF